MPRNLARLAGAAVLAFGLAAPALADWVNPFEYPQPAVETDEFFAVIEIPAGGSIKYEIDADNGALFVDRFMSMPVAYPGNYGSIPRSRGEDGDPVDVLVLTRQPIQPGALILVRAIGIMHMLDDGEVDDKIVAVPTSDIDPSYDEITDVSDLPAMELLRIEQFFSVYKNLPDPDDEVELSGFSGAEAAQAVVRAAITAYDAE